ncbi:MAG: MMPL family transporter, partial [Rubrobacteraceae bacterium]
PLPGPPPPAGGHPKHPPPRAPPRGGGAVVFAGSTVIIALVALSASGTALVAMLGYMAAVVVLAAVLGGITLLPAILGLLGRRVNSLPLPAMRRRRSDDGRLHGWTRWATFVGSRPWTAVIVGVVLLVILATPVLSLRLGQPDNGEMPRSTQLGQAYDLMTEGFGAGSNGPMLIAVDLSKPATNNQKELNELKQQQQQAIQQNTSEQQAKAENEIQQQADQKKQQANQEIQQQADQNKQQAAQEIQEQADQQAQGLSQEAQEEIDQQAQQQIAAENQQIQQQADQKKQQEAQSIQQQANQTKAEENQKIEQQVRQRVEQQTAQKEKFLESKASDPRLMDLRSDLQKTKGVDSVSFPLVDNQGNAAVYTLISKTAPSSAATTDLVDRLRDNVIPKDTRGEQMDAYVGGITAGYIDLASEITAKLPLVIAIVLVLSFLLLLLAFQSLVVSIKAVTMNVLSVLAAFGVLTYVFSHEWTANLIGLDNPIPIVSYVPLMMFAVLFGLSMDYEVFLMTEVRERWKATGDAHQAAVQGLAGTGRVIASAALIMVSVFLAFVLNGDPTIKQFGLGMAVAVAIDAPIVRCTLVPAIMTLLGRAGWWMPKWMKRVTPQLSIEGEQWFAERDAQGAGNAEPEKRPRVR